MNDPNLEFLGKANSLLRSAYAIALRRGEGTNWEAFSKQVRITLEEEQAILKEFWESKHEQTLLNLDSGGK